MAKFVSFGNTSEKYRIYSRRGIEKQIKAGNMTERDGQLIEEFVEVLKSENDLSPARAYKITNSLSNISRFIKKPFLDLTLGDLRAAANAIKEGEKQYSSHSPNKDPKVLSPNTQRDYITFLKRFYFWMIEEGYVDLPIDKIQKIKAPRANKLTKTASMMLSEEDIRDLIAACHGVTGVRDKALIAVVYEGALRIHEAALLKWGDIDFSDKRFAAINTAGKTGKPRYIPLPFAREYLAKWKSEYPEKVTDDKPVFITELGKSFTYAYLKNHLKKITTKAGVKEFVPHTLRHSRITNLARAGVSEVSIKQLAWGDVGSEMFATYAHLVNNDLDREILKASGIDPGEEEKVEPLREKACPRCFHINPPEKEFCEVCGCPLDQKTALELDDMKKEIHDEKYYQDTILKLSHQLKSLEAVVERVKGDFNIPEDQLEPTTQPSSTNNPHALTEVF